MENTAVTDSDASNYMKGMVDSILDPDSSLSYLYGVLAHDDALLFGYAAKEIALRKPSHDDLLKVLARNKAKEVYGLARHKGTPPEILHKVAQSSHQDAIRAVISNPGTGLHTLFRLLGIRYSAAREERVLRVLELRNPDSDALATLSAMKDPRILMGLIRYGQMGSRVLYQLSKNDFPNIYVPALQHPEMKRKLLLKIALNSAIDHKAMIASLALLEMPDWEETTPAGWWNKLAGSKYYPDILAAVAKKVLTRESILEVANSASGLKSRNEIFMSLLKNQALEQDIVEMIALVVIEEPGPGWVEISGELISCEKFITSPVCDILISQMELWHDCPAMMHQHSIAGQSEV